MFEAGPPARRLMELCMRPGRKPARRPQAASPVQGGFTYLGLIAAVAVLGVGLLAASEVWVTTARRERMVQLEWVGAQFVQAIDSYYWSSPGSVKTYPSDLNELLEDRRNLTMRRHLRQIYANPFSGKPDWALIAGPGGKVVGVRAVAQGAQGAEFREFVSAELGVRTR